MYSIPQSYNQTSRCKRCIYSNAYNPNEQRTSYPSEELELPGVGKVGREVGGTMLSVTGLNHFYYVRDFTDMRCKHSYQFMKVERNGGEEVYRIDWRDVVLLLESPIIKILKIK